LLLESLDRLSREKVSKALQLVLEMINDFGVTIWTLGGEEKDRIYNEDNFDLVDIVITICVMGRAHEESVLKRERIMEKRAIRMAIAKETGEPFWNRTWYWLEIKTRKDGTKYYHPIPERVKEVQLIFKLAAKGWGALWILKHLRAKGITNWSVSHLTRTLRNPAVLGWCQPYRNEDGRKIPDGEPWPDYYPRIIDQSVWDQVQLLQDAKVIKHNMIAGRKALINYPNNGGVLPGVPALLPGFGNGRLSELSLFTTSILLDESDEDE
jgi:DNA invertase Pin-like site-specific DNA recombinase